MILGVCCSSLSVRQPMFELSKATRTFPRPSAGLSLPLWRRSEL